MAWIPADGSAAPAWLSKSGRWQYPHAWMPDGTTLIVLDVPATRPNTIQLLTIADGQQPTPRPWRERGEAQPTNVGAPELSPDGRLLAYSTSETGQTEVYVEAFATPGTRRQVSAGSGANPLWAPNGRELFYTTRASQPSPETPLQMTAVEVGVLESGELRLGVIRPLFQGLWMTGARTMFDITPDGKRFLLVERDPLPPASAPSEIRLVVNWFEELKARVGGG